MCLLLCVFSVLILALSSLVFTAQEQWQLSQVLQIIPAVITAWIPNISSWGDSRVTPSLVPEAWETTQCSIGWLKDRELITQQLWRSFLSMFYHFSLQCQLIFYPCSAAWLWSARATSWHVPVYWNYCICPLSVIDLWTKLLWLLPGHKIFF